MGGRDASGVDMSRVWPKSNPAITDLIVRLKAHSRESGSPLWRDLARRLERPRSSWAEPNLSRVERYTDGGATIVVPGTLLGSGDISAPRTVAAIRITAGAREKVEAAGGRVMTLDDLMSESPGGKEVIILG